jgi:CARDB protein
MRRAAKAIASSAVVTASVAAALAPAAPAAKPVPTRSVTLSECHPSDDMTQRHASFAGQMRAVPGTARMAMRFTLQERLSSTHFKSVSLPDLRPWRRSKPGARNFIYTQRVTALHDGGSYRMRVQFRWYDSNGDLLRTNVARSGVCRQPVPQPNLTISSISPAAGPSADKSTYSVSVENAGAGEARDVSVSLKVDGTMVASSHIDLLPGNTSGVVQIVGPVCSFALRAIADPDRSIAETDETDNALTVPCTRAGA